MNLYLHKENPILISVILPVYNGERWITTMIESLLNQSFTGSWELIIVDDGSTDSTFSIIKKYADKHSFIHLFSQRNQGSGSARCKGIERSQGEFVAFVDADDWVSSDYLQKLFSHAIQNNADIVWCDCFREEKNSSIWKFECDNDCDLFIRKILLLQMWGAVWSKLIRRDIALKNIKYMSGLKQWEDIVFNVGCMLCNPRIAYLSEPLYHYRHNEESMCNTLFKRDSMLEFTRFSQKLVQMFHEYQAYISFEHEIKYCIVSTEERYKENLGKDYYYRKYDAIKGVNKYYEKTNRKNIIPMVEVLFIARKNSVFVFIELLVRSIIDGMIGWRETVQYLYWILPTNFRKLLSHFK